MAEIIHEHHEDSSVSLLVIVLIIIVVGGYLFWRYLPANTTNRNTNQPDVNLNVTLPPAAPATP